MEMEICKEASWIMDRPTDRKRDTRGKAQMVECATVMPPSFETGRVSTARWRKYYLRFFSRSSRGVVRVVIYAPKLRRFRNFVMPRSLSRTALRPPEPLLYCALKASGMHAAGGARETAKEIIQRTVREKGVQGLYCGYWATLSRNIPSAVIRFSLYEEIKL